MSALWRSNYQHTEYRFNASIRSHRVRDTCPSLPSLSRTGSLGCSAGEAEQRCGDHRTQTRAETHAHAHDGEYLVKHPRDKEEQRRGGRPWPSKNPGGGRCEGEKSQSWNLTGGKISNDDVARTLLLAHTSPAPRELRAMSRVALALEPKPRNKANRHGNKREKTDLARAADRNAEPFQQLLVHPLVTLSAGAPFALGGRCCLCTWSAAAPAESAATTLACVAAAARAAGPRRSAPRHISRQPPSFRWWRSRRLSVSVSAGPELPVELLRAPGRRALGLFVKGGAGVPARVASARGGGGGSAAALSRCRRLFVFLCKAWGGLPAALAARTVVGKRFFIAEPLCCVLKASSFSV